MLRSVVEKNNKNNSPKVDNFCSKKQSSNKEDNFLYTGWKSVEQYDHYIKLTLKFRMRDYLRRVKRRQKKVLLFSELSGTELHDLAVTDEYFVDDDMFDVSGLRVSVSDPDIAEALRGLSSRKRDVILLYFFSGMKDWEIAKRMKLTNSTIAKDRRRALKLLRSALEGMYNE